MNVKSVMSFGLELVGFGAKRQNVQDKLNLQCFRSHFGIGPEAIPASTHDITFFRGGTQVSTNRLKNEAIWDQNALYFKIPEGKRLIGDSGYKGEPSIISTSVDEHSDKVKEFFARAKSGQETINTR
ncbi:hypothetical protein ACHAW5_007529 [Stephanodiscus triporus]|uniref:DDE Tnp4 domain-containing protein n=1 Tax=Stephanodiscus triporus TaxID=2934178 RepID=A0ABD3PEF9_9STRA